MGRAPCCDKDNVKRGPWSPEEDSKLKEYIEKYGTGANWISLPQKVGLRRCGKSCRLRWLNYLRPNLKHGGFSEEEDNIICSLYTSIGSRWSIIAAQLPGRTDNDIKNYWNTKLKNKLLGKGKDRQTRRLAAAKQKSKDMQSYATSGANPNPSIYGPQHQPGGIDKHTNINMNGPYCNFGPEINSQLFEQNCGATITESSSSSGPATFQLNGQQVQLDQELADHNSSLRKLLQRLEGTVVDHHNSSNMTMINTSSPIQASDCINTSEIMHSIAYNQYNSDAVSQISYETAASSVLMFGGHMENHTKLENPSAAFTQNDNLLFFPSSTSPEGGNYESAWMNTFSAENNLGASGFSTGLNDLILYNNISPVQQRDACNYDCGSISIY